MVSFKKIAVLSILLISLVLFSGCSKIVTKIEVPDITYFTDNGTEYPAMQPNEGFIADVMNKRVLRYDKERKLLRKVDLHDITSKANEIIDMGNLIVLNQTSLNGIILIF